MSLLLVGSPRMAKKMGRPPTNRDDVSVKIPRAIALKGKAVAKDRGMTLAEFLEELLTLPVDKHYAAMLRRIDKAQEKAGGA